MQRIGVVITRRIPRQDPAIFMVRAEWGQHSVQETGVKFCTLHSGVNFFSHNRMQACPSPSFLLLHQLEDRKSQPDFGMRWRKRNKMEKKKWIYKIDANENLSSNEAPNCELVNSSNTLKFSSEWRIQVFTLEDDRPTTWKPWKEVSFSFLAKKNLDLLRSPRIFGIIVSLQGMTCKMVSSKRKNFELLIS